MAFDFVTSRQNKAHVTAEQAGALNISIFGNGRYITKYAQGLEVSVASSNKVNIAPGALIVDGRFVVNERAEQVTIANGTQGKWRKDLVILTLKVDASTGVGTTALSTIQGVAAVTQDAAKDPTYTPGNLSKGQYQAQVPVARVILDGLTPTVELALPTIEVLSSSGDDFDVVSCESPIGAGRARNLWHIWRRGDSVTVFCKGFTKDGGAWETAYCPITIPENSRFKSAEEGIKAAGATDRIADFEPNTIRVPVCFRDSQTANVHLCVTSDGRAYLQNMGGGGHDNNWRWATLTYTVAPSV